MKRSSIVSSALILTAGNIFLRLTGMLFQVFLSRKIGAESLGLLQLVTSVSILAGALGCSGAKVAAMYLSAEEYGLKRYAGIRKAVHGSLIYGSIVSCAAAVLLLLLSNQIACRWIGSTQSLDAIRIIAVFLPFTCLSMIMAGYFTACGRVRQLVTIEITERLVCLLLTFAMLVLWAKDDTGRVLSAIMLGSCVGCVVDFLILYGIFRKNTSSYPEAKQPLHIPSRLLRLCVPLAFNDYLRHGLAAAEQFLIPYGLKRHGSGYAEAMASYGTLHGMVFPLLMFPAVLLQSLSELLVPTLARSRAEKNTQHIRRLTGRCLRASLLFTLVTAGFFLCTAKPLGRLIYKSDSAGTGMLIFAPMLLMLYMDAIVDGMLKGLAQQLSCVRYNTLTNFLDVLLLLILLPKWGMTGYCVCFAFTHLINFILSLRRLCKVAEYRIHARYCTRMLLCAAIATAVAAVVPLSRLPLLSQVLFRGSIFLLLSLLTPGGIRLLPLRYLRRRQIVKASYNSTAAPYSPHGTSAH